MFPWLVFTSTRAGLNLARDKSENGNGANIIELAVTAPTLRPPQAGSNPRQELLE